MQSGNKENGSNENSPEDYKVYKILKYGHHFIICKISYIYGNLFE